MSSIPTPCVLPFQRAIYCPSLLAYTGELVVGKKILCPDLFFPLICNEINHYDDGPLPSPTGNEEWWLPLSPEVLPYVSADIGSAIGRTAEDYIVREQGGYMLPCLRRTYAFPAEAVWVKVISAQTYAEQHRTKVPKKLRLSEDAVRYATHIIIDFRVVAGPAEARNAYLNPYQMARKIAGGTIGIHSAYAKAAAFLAATTAFALVAD